MGKDGHFAISQIGRWLPRVSAGVLLGLAIVPTRWIEAGPSLCLIKNTFGMECAGCGMTRALSNLLHGSFEAGLAYNRGSIVVLPMLIILALLVMREIPWRPL